MMRVALQTDRTGFPEESKALLLRKMEHIAWQRGNRVVHVRFSQGKQFVRIDAQEIPLKERNGV